MNNVSFARNEKFRVKEHTRVWYMILPGTLAGGDTTHIADACSSDAIHPIHRLRLRLRLRLSLFLVQPRFLGTDKTASFDHHATATATGT